MKRKVQMSKDIYLTFEIELLDDGIHGVSPCDKRNFTIHSAVHSNLRKTTESKY